MTSGLQNSWYLRQVICPVLQADKSQIISSELFKIKLEIVGRTQVSQDLQDCLLLLRLLRDNWVYP